MKKDKIISQDLWEMCLYSICNDPEDGRMSFLSYLLMKAWVEVKEMEEDTSVECVTLDGARKLFKRVYRKETGREGFWPESLSEESTIYPKQLVEKMAELLASPFAPEQKLRKDKHLH